MAFIQVPDFGSRESWTHLSPISSTFPQLLCSTTLDPLGSIVRVRLGPGTLGPPEGKVLESSTKAGIPEIGGLCLPIDI